MKFDKIIIMNTVKKGIFGVVFLGVYAGMVMMVGPLVAEGNNIFSLDLGYLNRVIEVAGLLLLSGTLFAVFGILASDWAYVLPVSLLASVAPMLLLPVNVGYVLGVGTALSLIITYSLLSPRLKTYVNFSANQILGPSVKLLVTLLMLVISLVYFLNAKAAIDKNGFEIPDSLIETALKLSPASEVSIDSAPKLPISQDQINELKKNPDLLKQYGVDPKILDTINQPAKQVTNATNDLIKKTIKDQVAQLVRPYLGFIAPLFGLLFYLSLSTFTSLLMILVYPLLWLIFYLLKLSGYVHFEKEMREVQKLVV